MSDFEAFSFQEAGESYDPAAFERFKERVKKNAQFVAAQKKQEQRQKKKEDALLKILMSFFQRHQHSGILLLAARLLEQNIPASFVLAVIILGNEELQKEASQALLLEGAVSAEEAPATKAASDSFAISIIPKFTESALPLSIKADVDAWGRGLYQAAEAQPYRILETVPDQGGVIKKVVPDCAANVLYEFLEKSGLSDFSYETSFEFCEFLIQGILNHIKKVIENQKLLEGSGENPYN